MSGGITSFIIRSSRGFPDAWIPLKMEPNLFTPPVEGTVYYCVSDECVTTV